MRPQVLLLGVAAAVGVGGCGDGSGTTGPDATSAMTIASTQPTAGTIVLPPEHPYIIPGGIVIPQNSGHLSVHLTMTSAHEAPWAKLNVYLTTGGKSDEWCGDNGPDSPTWGFLKAGWTTTYTVTGFRIYRLPCDVTGVRAMLHMRNNGLNTPPTSAETIAEASTPVTLRIVR